VVYQNTHELMTGGLFTTPCNTPTVFNELVVCVLAYERDHNPERFQEYMFDMTKFHRENPIVTYGDDGMGRTMSSLTEVDLNPYDKAIYGREFTAANKVPGFGEDDVIHLSRCPSRYGWRLPGATIEAIPLYRFRNSIPDAEMYVSLCEAALQEWFFWGPDVFGKWKKIYDDELSRLGFSLTRYDYAKYAQDMINHH